MHCGNNPFSARDAIRFQATVSLNKSVWSDIIASRSQIERRKISLLYPSTSPFFFSLVKKCQHCVKNFGRYSGDVFLPVDPDDPSTIPFRKE
jgi:hypothetical protein